MGVEWYGNNNFVCGMGYGWIDWFRYNFDCYFYWYYFVFFIVVVNLVVELCCGKVDSCCESNFVYILK